MVTVPFILLIVRKNPVTLHGQIATNGNELLSPSNAPAVFIKEFCLVIFYGFLGVKLSSYIFDVWL